MYRCPSAGYEDIKGSRGLALNIPNLRETRTQVVNFMPLLLDTWQNASSNVKLSCNRPGVAQRVSGGLGSQISMTFGT